MDWLPLVIQLLSGAAGGNIVASIFKNINMGTLVNSILGIAGGGLGGSILASLGLGGAAAANASTGLDVGSILGSIAGGGAGGGVLLTIVSLIKRALGGK